MGGTPSYLTTIKKSGTATTFTSEAMTGSGVGPYQITDVTKRIWDRLTALVFYEDSVAIAASDILTIDYLFGKVTFVTTKSGAISVDGKYMPMTSIVGANTYTMTLTTEVLDDTEFDLAVNAGFRSKKYGLLDVSVTVSRWDDLTQALFNIFNDRSVVVIEIQPGGSGIYARGWFVLESVSPGADVASLENEDLSFQLDGNADSDFSIST